MSDFDFEPVLSQSLVNASNFFDSFSHNLSELWDNNKMKHIFYIDFMKDRNGNGFTNIYIDNKYKKTTKTEILEELTEIMGVSPDDYHYFKISFCVRVVPDNTWLK